MPEILDGDLPSIEPIPESFDQIDVVNRKFAALDSVLSPDFAFDKTKLVAASMKYRAALATGRDWREELEGFEVPLEYLEFVDLVDGIIANKSLPMGFPYIDGLWDNLVNNPNYVFAGLARDQFRKVLPTLYAQLLGKYPVAPESTEVRNITVVILGVGNGDEVQDILNTFAIEGDFNSHSKAKINFLAIDQNPEALKSLKRRFQTENADLFYGKDFEIYTVQDDFTDFDINTLATTSAGIPANLLQDVPRLLIMKGITSGNMPLVKLPIVCSEFLRRGDYAYIDASMATVEVDEYYIQAVKQNYDSLEFRELATFRFYQVLRRSGVPIAQIKACFDANGKDKNLRIDHELRPDGSFSVKMIYSIPAEWVKILKDIIYREKHEGTSPLDIVCYSSDRNTPDNVQQSLSSSFATLGVSSTAVDKMLYYFGQKR
jgi:hypothetical protein